MSTVSFCVAYGLGGVRKASRDGAPGRGEDEVRGREEKIFVVVASLLL